MDMGKLNVKDGTPVGTQHLCKSCRSGQYVTGYRESDVLVFCTLSNPSFRLPFIVHECSDFDDKHKPTWQQMEKLAIAIAPARVSKKTRGFQTGGAPETEKLEYEAPPLEDEDEDEEFEDVDAVAEVALSS